MKKILLLALILTHNVYAADGVKAKNTTDLLATYTTPSSSTTPDRGIAVRSNRDNVDDHETIATSAMTVSKTATQVIFTRGESLALTNCSADGGTVSVTATQIKINSTNWPAKVLCSEANGIQRVFYTSYKAP